jgi:nucleoid DNA-binding protein
MKKNELLKKIRIRAEITNVETAAFYRAFIEVLGATLAAGDEVSLQHFGRFATRKTEERQISLFGKKTRVGPGRRIVFRPFKGLSAKI